MNNDKNRDNNPTDPDTQHHFYVENNTDNPAVEKRDTDRVPTPHHSPEDDRDRISHDWNPNPKNEEATTKSSGDSSIAAGTNPDRYSKDAYNPAVDGSILNDSTKDATNDEDNPAFRTPGL